MPQGNLCSANIRESKAGVDLLVFGNRPGKMVKLEVKSKQGNDWPNCRGIHEADTFLVFVDFLNVEQGKLPDFYILSAAEWRSIVLKVKRQILKKDRRAEVGKDNVLVLPDQVGKYGVAYRGCGVKPAMIKDHATKTWDKIINALA